MGRGPTPVRSPTEGDEEPLGSAWAGPRRTVRGQGVVTVTSTLSVRAGLSASVAVTV